MKRSDLLAQIALGEDSTRQFKVDVKNADSLAQHKSHLFSLVQKFNQTCEPVRRDRKKSCFFEGISPHPSPGDICDAAQTGTMVVYSRIQVTRK